MTLRVRFGYPCKLKRKGVEILHDMFSSKLDSRGETTHDSLSDCLGVVINELNKNHVISSVTVYSR